MAINALRPGLTPSRLAYVCGMNGTDQKLVRKLTLTGVNWFVSKLCEKYYQLCFGVLYVLLRGGHV